MEICIYTATPNYLTDLGLWREPKALVSAIESYKLRFEHGVSVNLQGCPTVALHTTEAGRARSIYRRECDLVPRNVRNVTVSNRDPEIG